MIDHNTLLAYYKHPYWHELERSQKERFRTAVMDKYGKDCGLACYNYEFQRYVTKSEDYFNELAHKLGIAPMLPLPDSTNKTRITGAAYCSSNRHQPSIE